MTSYEEEIAQLHAAIRLQELANQIWVERLRRTEAERDAARVWRSAIEARLDVAESRLAEAAEHLGLLLGADPGERYAATAKAAREWWLAYDERLKQGARP